MADNVAITAGTGTTVAADEVTDGTLGTVKAQFVKVMDGTLDSTNKWKVNANGSAYVILTDAAGNEISPSAKSENGASSGGDGLNPMGVVYRSAKTAPNGVTGDYTWGSVSGNGDLRVDGGKSFITSAVTLATAAAAYAAGDVVGTDAEVANCARFSGDGGYLTGIRLTGSSAVAANEFTVYVFTQEPATGTYTDNGAMTLDTADARFCIGAWTLDNVDPEGFVTWKEGISKAYTCNATSLWILVRSAAYTGTPGGATDFQVTLELVRD